MLYLTRKIGESVIINDNIEVTVVDIRGKSIKLGFTFPPEATVLRRELYERIQAENRAAAAAAGGDALVLALGGDTAQASHAQGTHAQGNSAQGNSAQGNPAADNPAKAAKAAPAASPMENPVEREDEGGD